MRLCDPLVSPPRKVLETGVQTVRTEQDEQELIYMRKSLTVININEREKLERAPSKKQVDVRSYLVVGCILITVRFQLVHIM